jgi:hypothetical protein
MKVSLSGGQAQGILTTWPAALVIPSQSPVPVGFKPEGWPRSGTRAGSTPPAAGAGGAGAGAGVAGAGAGVGGAVPSWIAFCWARNVVEAAGQPTPGPLRFWRVTSAACIRVSWDSLEPSVGKETATEGLLTAFPAATFALKDYAECK